MKRIIYISFLVLTLISLNNFAFAGTTYPISSNKNWSSVLPSTCANCTINISSGVTLTIDVAATCQNCTFQGGAIVLNNQTLNLQYAGSTTTTYFTGTQLTANGNNAKVIVNAPLALSNTTFTFNNSSYFNTSYQVDMTASTVNLNDNATMYSTGGSDVPLNLISNSRIIVGNGSSTSNAAFTVSGPTLTLFDQSSLSIGNVNNAYNNWASYSYRPTVTSNAHAAKSYSTLDNNMDCGSGYPHACSNPAVYGPVALTSTGLVSGRTLPVVLVGFTVILNNDKSVTLSWNTQVEVNSSRFVVERSADGETWSPVGTVQAKGNSAIQSDYSFTDAFPLAGTNLYRLRMIDLDNSYGYTEVKAVRTSSVVNSVSFYPNPAREYVNVALGTVANTQLTVRLINVSGQVLQEKRVSSGSGVVVSFAVANYAPGLYILSVIDESGVRESRQLVISRS